MDSEQPKCNEQRTSQELHNNEHSLHTPSHSPIHPIMFTHTNMEDCSVTPISGMYPHLDRFQIMKKERMKNLLLELEEAKAIPVRRFLSMVAVNYGIRRTTALEYIRDWEDGGYISVEKNVIKFIKRPDEMEQ